MNLVEKQTVGTTVALDYRTASVFQKYGIDFCCKGGQTIDEACSKKGIDKENLLLEIKKTIANTQAVNDEYNTWPLDKLVDYIVQQHHTYVTQQTPVLLSFLNKLCKVHGQRHPELLEVYAEFINVAEELSDHMEKEEVILFPFIKQMVDLKNNNQKITEPNFGTVKNPIAMMQQEHSVEGDRFFKIAELTKNYTTPDDGCTTYRVTFNMLNDFELNLHKHIHLENNILFPKAIELEQLFN